MELKYKKRQQEFCDKMAENAAKRSELLQGVSTVDTKMESDQVGTKVIEGWEQLVKTTATTTILKKLIVCNGAVERRDEKVQEAIRIERGTPKTHTDQHCGRMGGVC